MQKGVDKVKIGLKNNYFKKFDIKSLLSICRFAYLVQNR